jgi:hypothetical protein
MKNFVKILISALFLATIVWACSKENSLSNPTAQQSVANTDAAEATSRSSQPGSKIKVEVLEMSNVESGVWVCIGTNPGPCQTTSLLASPNALTPCGQYGYPTPTYTTTQTPCLVYPNATTVPTTKVASSSTTITICGGTCSNFFASSIPLPGTVNAKIVIKLSVVNFLTGVATDSRTYTIVRTAGSTSAPIVTASFNGLSGLFL